jgi:hypothetical protein
VAQFFEYKFLEGEENIPASRIHHLRHFEEEGPDYGKISVKTFIYPTKTAIILCKTH